MSSLLSLVPRSSPSCMTRSGAHTPATSRRTQAPVSHFIYLYTNYSNDKVSVGLGRSGNRSQVERVAISSGKANVASVVGTHLTFTDHLELDLSPTPAIARGTTVASSVHGVSTQRTMRVTTSASLLLNSPGVVVTAETLKHGGYRLVVHTILPRRAQAERQKLSPAT